MWWLTSGISKLGRQRPGNQEFKVSLSYLERFCIKKIRNEDLGIEFSGRTIGLGFDFHHHKKQVKQVS